MNGGEALQFHLGNIITFFNINSNGDTIVSSALTNQPSDHCIWHCEEQTALLNEAVKEQGFNEAVDDDKQPRRSEQLLTGLHNRV